MEISSDESESDEDAPKTFEVAVYGSKYFGDDMFGSRQSGGRSPLSSPFTSKIKSRKLEKPLVITIETTEASVDETPNITVSTEAAETTLAERTEGDKGDRRRRTNVFKADGGQLLASSSPKDLAFSQKNQTLGDSAPTFASDAPKEAGSSFDEEGSTPAVSDAGTQVPNEIEHQKIPASETWSSRKKFYNWTYEPEPDLLEMVQLL